MAVGGVHRWQTGFRVVWALALATAHGAGAVAAPPRIEVTFDAAVRAEPYTGRVYVVATRRTGQSPLDGVNWFDTQPFFAQDVENWAPGDVLRLDPAKCLGYPDDLEHLAAGTYRVQAVLDLNGWSHDVIQAPGNGISPIVRLEHDPDRPGRVKLRIDRTLPPLHLIDTDDLKYARLRSDVLSAFYGRHVHLYAAVALPGAYQRDKVWRFPTLYLVPGFGGTIRDEGYVRMMRGLLDQAGFDAVVVYLDADCPTGHHVFADSANNGPWGTALVTELIPYLEQRFRLIAGTDARYVTGASSGGWSSLWLQITYPETFGGVWSLSPDPVDFSAFQTINIYDPNENFLVDANGKPRPVTRPMTFGKALVLRDFCRMEEVLGRGGQFQSFDAVFSPRGPDGQPLPLWDRHTGRVDPQVAEAWKKYDIRLLLESSWKSLGPRLRGKLHLYCGDEDDFFLERAFARLCDTLKKLGSDAYMEVVPGGGHALPPPVWLRAIEQMKQQYEAHYGARVVFSRVRGTTLQARLAPRRLPAAGGIGSVRVGDGEDAGDDAVEDGLDTRLNRVDGGRSELVGDRVVA